ncbi:hypothetical protein F0562_007499 [Nyssa sinensis]|uniref:Uncharacterized protein n=1 Tax=Nyssa sinensis TaxID=561372 RepID=A0A5J5A5S6_9ASTE|nr:hypothetical protein F0562_007499 [Nyssa sinensis]
MVDEGRQWSTVTVGEERSRDMRETRAVVTLLDAQIRLLNLLPLPLVADSIRNPTGVSFTCHSSFLCFSPSSGMSGGAQNFPMGSNAHEQPEEENRQSGAWRSRVACAGSEPPLPSSVVHSPIINGTQLHDNAFMGSWSTGSSFHMHNPTSFHNSSGSTIGTSIGSQLTSRGPIGLSQAQHQEDSSALLDSDNMPIRSGLMAMGQRLFTPARRWIISLSLAFIKDWLFSRRHTAS